MVLSNTTPFKKGQFDIWWTMQHIPQNKAFLLMSMFIRTIKAIITVAGDSWLRSTANTIWLQQIAVVMHS